MTLKRSRIISTIGIFLLCFLFHFLYEWLPSSITAIFFPVNESIWEHMKLLFSAVVFYGIIDYMSFVTFFPQLIAGPIVRYSTIEKHKTKAKSTFNNLLIII